MKSALFCMSVCLLLATTSSPVRGQDRQAEDYTLSMTGALINDHCGRVWQDLKFVNIHACNYQLANRFTLATATQHFDECAEIVRGDIVRIADCMVERFNAWLALEGQ